MVSVLDRPAVQTGGRETPVEYGQRWLGTAQRLLESQGSSLSPAERQAFEMSHAYIEQSLEQGDRIQEAIEQAVSLHGQIWDAIQAARAEDALVLFNRAEAITEKLQQRHGIEANLEVILNLLKQGKNADSIMSSFLPKAQPRARETGLTTQARSAQGLARKRERSAKGYNKNGRGG